jgi:hypothetical protein
LYRSVEKRGGRGAQASSSQKPEESVEHHSLSALDGMSSVGGGVDLPFASAKIDTITASEKQDKELFSKDPLQNTL